MPRVGNKNFRFGLRGITRSSDPFSIEEWNRSHLKQLKEFMRELEERATDKRWKAAQKLAEDFRKKGQIAMAESHLHFAECLRDLWLELAGKALTDREVHVAWLAQRLGYSEANFVAYVLAAKGRPTGSQRTKTARRFKALAEFERKHGSLPSGKEIADALPADLVPEGLRTGQNLLSAYNKSRSPRRGSIPRES